MLYLELTPIHFHTQEEQKLGSSSWKFFFFTFSFRLESTWGILTRCIAHRSPSQSFKFPGSSRSQQETGMERLNESTEKPWWIFSVNVLILNDVHVFFWYVCLFFCQLGVCMVLLRTWCQTNMTWKLFRNEPGPSICSQSDSLSSVLWAVFIYYKSCPKLQTGCNCIKNT